MTDVEKPTITHYLVSFTAQGEPVDKIVIANELGKAMGIAGVDLLMAMIYVSDIGVDPRDVGIKDTWLVIPEDERMALRTKYPHLVTAIELICCLGKGDLR